MSVRLPLRRRTRQRQPTAASKGGERSDAARATDTPLPHEKDQAVGQVARQPDPVMTQAKADLDAGLVDTDLRATPGLDAARRDALMRRERRRPAPPVPAKPAKGR